MTNEEWIALTDEDRAAAFNSMPDMLDGFLKTWGWLHFAKAIEAKCREKNARPLPQATLSEEREAFEAHILKGLRESQPDRTDFDYFTDRMFRGERYVMGWVQSQWEGWSARAVLAAARQVPVPFDKEAWIEAVWAAMRDLAQDGSGSVKAMNIHTVRLFCEESWKRAASPSPVGQEEPGCSSGGSDGVMAGGARPNGATEQNASMDEYGRFCEAMRRLSNGEPDWSSPAAQWAWAAWREALAAPGVDLPVGEHRES